MNCLQYIEKHMFILHLAPCLIVPEALSAITATIGKYISKHHTFRYFTAENLHCPFLPRPGRLKKYFSDGLIV